MARPGLLLAFMKLYCMNGDVEACGRICHHLNQRGEKNEKQTNKQRKCNITQK